MQTRDQKYATIVFKQVKDEVAEKGGSVFQPLMVRWRSDYRVLIRSAGLAQAVAFVQARHKPETPQRKLLDHLSIAVNTEDLAHESRITTQLSEYMRLTHEVMAALVWYKRFAQSVLEC